MSTPLDYAARIAYSSKDTLKFTYDMAVKYKDSPGVYLEAGVAAGAQIIAMAYGAPNKTIYAFDSFEGIPLPSNRDDQMPGIALLSETEQKMLPDPGKQALKSSGATVVSREDFMNHLKQSGVKYDLVVPIGGWFEEVFDKLSFMMNDFPQIALIRLDGDLYNSTFVCLQNLFPKVIQGGCVIIDDWELKGCREACEEYFKLIGYEPKYIHEPICHFFK